ncbi:MAG TPA: IclR family transcriptional regulator C-terminal domain-containing protein [Candidatus Polarisedimenticolia bacterium]|nr:IclR family transcriptional regulator C-terminal domain-containing protein [Candidatus Polarisedimenticolia bacterium]
MNTANRLLGILGLFTVEKPEWTVEEAAKEIGVSISTAYRYFRDLCRVGLLDPFSGGKYVLGPAVIENDRKIRLTDPLIKVGRPAMQRLVARSGSLGVALLCRIYRNRVMCVHQEARVLPENTVGYERGRPMPMFQGASSKVIFANLPSRTVRWFFEKYPQEIAAAGLGSDWETIKTTLRRIRRAGLHISRGEVDSGRVGVAAPVFGPDKNVIGSIAMAIPQSEATPQFVANISALVQAAGREIDAGLQLIASEEIAEDGGIPPIYREPRDSEDTDIAGSSEGW